ncbi:hypothetical protein LY41_003255 [Prauserella halophila]|nr:hypothetical protein [Prauserella halophila]
MTDESPNPEPEPEPEPETESGPGARGHSPRLPRLGNHEGR